MIAVVHRDSYEKVPSELKMYQHSSSQIFLTMGKEYEVHAVTVFEGLVLFQVADDLRYPAWYPAWLFNIVDTAIPDDWICNSFHDEPKLVVGPSFFVQDEASYCAMVELEPEPVEQFWSRVNRRS